MRTMSRTCRGSTTVTEGIRIEVAPRYLAEHSQPGMNAYNFAYRVRISNESERRVKLISRAWRIVDADGHQHLVNGEGVVGQQPELQPGEAFEYSSHCKLDTPWGTMEGHYTFTRDGGEALQAAIGRFYLVAPEAVQ